MRYYVLEKKKREMTEKVQNESQVVKLLSQAHNGLCHQDNWNYNKTLFNILA